MADNFDLKKYLVENKLGPFSKVTEAIERMEGLIDQKMLKAFLLTSHRIIEDLVEDGFEEGDVVLHLVNQLKNLDISLSKAGVRVPGSKNKSSLEEYNIEVDDEGYATDDEGNRKFVGKQFAGDTLSSWPGGRAEPFVAKGSYIPRSAVKSHPSPEKTEDQKEKEKKEIDLISKKLIDKGLFSADTEIKSGEMFNSFTKGKLKHNEDIRKAIDDIADKHDISYSIKDKYWHKFW